MTDKDQVDSVLEDFFAAARGAARGVRRAGALVVEQHIGQALARHHPARRGGEQRNEEDAPGA